MTPRSIRTIETFALEAEGVQKVGLTAVCMMCSAGAFHLFTFAEASALDLIDFAGAHYLV